MGAVPQRARDLMSHGKVMALATSSAAGEPNVVPMKQCWWFDDDTLLVGDFFMKATRANVLENGRASFSLWQDEPREAYKFTGSANYVTGGPEYDMANNEMKKKMPEKDFKGVVVIKVETVFDVLAGPTAGEIITD